MGPYDNKDIYDDQQGLGTPSSSSPGFEPPETYPAAPEIHNPETAATNGASGDNPVNSATQQEQSAMGNNEEDDGSEDGSAPGDMSGGQPSQNDSHMKYTGNGKNNQSFGERMKKSFGAKGTALRAKNKILLATFGVFIVGIIVAVILIMTSIPGIQVINASSYLMGSFGIAANQANETYAKILSADGKDPTKTRLSVDKQILTKVTRATMKKAGIDFTYDNRGRAVSAHLDPAKNSELRGSESAIKKAVSEKFGISASDVSIVRSGMSYDVVLNMHNKTVRVQENIIRDFAARTGRGKVMTLLTAHHFRDSLRVPSLFKPFQRAKEAAANKIGRYIDTKVRENERIKDLKAKVDNVRASMRQVFEAHSAKITVGRVTGSMVMLMCAVREMADGIEEKNYEQVQTAQQAALDMIAQGNQVAYSESSTTNTVTHEQIDSAASHMYGTYQGQTYSILDSASIRAQQGLPPVTFKDSAAQAQYDFDRQTVASSFSNVSSWKVARDFTTALGGDAICKEPIQSLLTFADIGITIGSAFATGGAGAAFKAAASAGVTMGVVSLVMSMAVAGSTNKLPDITPNQGLLGGDFSSYGAKSAANVTSATAGGVIVASDRASELENNAKRIDIAMAKNQSLASKLSPTNKYSPIAKLANGISPVPAQNARNVASSFANIIMSTIRLPFTLFSSHASAQSASSSDTIVQPTASSAQAAANAQGISTSDTKAPTVALTAAVEKLIKTKDSGVIMSDAASIVRGQGYTGSYATRAGACFGMKFLDSTDSDGGTYFDIQYDHQVDIYNAAYTSSNCADENDKSWVTVSAAVHIIAVAEAATCRETGDDDACTRTGAGAVTTTLASDTADTSGAVGEPNTSTGRAQGSWGGFSNGKIPASEPTMTKITSSFLGVNKGDTIQICNTKVSEPYLNPSAAVSIKALNDAFMQKYGHMMYFQSCYRAIGEEGSRTKATSSGQWYAYLFLGGADVGTSNHGWGLAVDIGPNPKKDQGCDPDSSNLTSAEKEMCQWITDNAPKYGWKNGKDVVPSEQWHFEYSRTLPTGSST